MNKTEFIKELSKELNISKVESKKNVEAMESIILKTLSNGEKVTLTGFGTFDTTHRKERKGRNPKTNQPMILPAHEAPVFRFANNIKKSFR